MRSKKKSSPDGYVTLHIYLRKEEYEQLKEKAQKRFPWRSRAVGDLIRELIYEHIKK